MRLTLCLNTGKPQRSLSISDSVDFDVDVTLTLISQTQQGNFHKQVFDISYTLVADGK